MKTTKITQLMFLIPLLGFFVACEKDAEPIVDYVFEYQGENFSTNAAEELALRGALADLTAEMKKGRTNGTTVDYARLSELFEAGSPALSEVSTDYYRGRIAGSGGWLEELSKASGGTYSPGTPQGEGGVYGGYLFDENGLELEQVVEKGLFAAALYQQAVDVLRSEHDETTADRVVALFGAHPDFSNSDNSNLDNPDVFSAKYTARRDKNDGMGLYSIMFHNFEALQTSIRIGEELDGTKTTAIAGIKSTWEKAIFATVVNYLHTAISKLSNTNPTDGDIASALHAYSEAVGFVHGWRGIAAADKIITETEIDDLLVMLNAPYNDVATSYAFVTDAVNELPKMTQAIDQVQAIYGFSDQDIEDFKENWVSKQGR